MCFGRTCIWMLLIDAGCVLQRAHNVGTGRRAGVKTPEMSRSWMGSQKLCVDCAFLAD